MPTVASILTLEVPSTTANLGPGFDSLGLALADLNRWTLELVPAQDGATCQVVACTGFGKDSLPTTSRHLFFKSWETLHDLGYGPDLLAALVQANLSAHLSAHNATPLARGLGSSAALRVASAAAYLHLCGQDVSQSWKLAAVLEGHPDNAAPAGLGGLVASLADDDGNWQALALPLHSCWQVVALIPDFPLLTADARRVLPQHYDKSDALYNIARLPFLLEGLRIGNDHLVHQGCQDHLHQPQRAPLIPGFLDVVASGVKAGAAAVFLSGAGPTVAAFVNRQTHVAPQVAEAMRQAFLHSSILAVPRIFEPDNQGLNLTLASATIDFDI